MVHITKSLGIDGQYQLFGYVSIQLWFKHLMLLSTDWCWPLHGGFICLDKLLLIMGLKIEGHEICLCRLQRCWMNGPQITLVCHDFHHTHQPRELMPTLRMRFFYLTLLHVVCCSRAMQSEDKFILMCREKSTKKSMCLVFMHHSWSLCVTRVTQHQ